MINKTRFFLNILFAGLLTLSFTAEAALELELTQGVGSALPIAIMSFATNGGGLEASKNLNEVINNDLQNSGRFRLLSIAAAPLQNSTNPDYNYWRTQKAENIVTGSVQASGSQYQVSFQLHDVYSKSILLEQKYTVSSTQMRKLSHRISDTIYEKLIGIPGIFSTQIAYILVQKNARGKPIKYNLEIADADGVNPQSLLTSNQPIMSQAWSPDGKQIAYVSFEGNRSAIYVQNINNGQRQIIAKFPGINGAPAWSPDGRKMALVLTQTGDPKIYILDLTNKQLHQVTSGWSLDTEPTWMPDGRSILFTSNRGGSSPQIYKVDISTGGVQRVTYEGNYNARPSVSANGKTLVVLHQDGNLFGIAVQDLASGRLTKVTQSGYNESPTLAPNGYMIAYASNQNGRGVLAEVSVDGRVKLFLPAREGEVQEPAWGPFTH